LLFISGCSIANQTKARNQQKTQEKKKVVSSLTDEEMKKLENFNKSELTYVEGGYQTDGKEIGICVYTNARICKVLLNADLNSFKGFTIDGANHYAKDKRYVFWNDQKIDGADPESFELMNNHFTKDKNNLYCDGKITTKVDKESFVALTENLSKDVSHVYYDGCNFKIFQAVDLGSFEIIGTTTDSSYSSYSRDKNHAFFNNSHGAPVVIKGIDAASLEYLGGYYIKDSKGIYYFLWTNPVVRLEGVDVDSFTVNYAGIAKDKNHTYYKGRINDK
jgi:hypothetical protein